MKEQGIKGKFLEESLKMSPNTLAKLRTDKGIRECRIDTLARVAEALGVSVKDLFDEVEEPKG